MSTHAAVARDLTDSIQYLTLATADREGLPWASPVWFAHEAYIRFIWVSKPEARHSQNIAARPEIALVIFDSTVPPGTGQAVYVEATAEQLAGDEAADSIAVFSGRSQAHGGPAWTLDDVTPPAHLRLYRATARAHYALGPNDERVPVDLG